jgi:hypothetical protein
MHERAWRGGRGWSRLGVALIVAGSVTGCAIPFGEDPDPGRPDRTPREQNRLYLEEQERVERARQQSFEPVRPSER